MRLRALCCLPLLSAVSIACGPPVDALQACHADSDCGPSVTGEFDATLCDPRVETGFSFEIFLCNGR